MNYKEFTTAIKERIATLTSEKQLELAIIICKKLFFDYQKFSEIYQWGDSDLLLDTIKICEQYSVNEKPITEVKTLIAKIDLIVPHMDDFGDEIGSYALNASASVYETLEFIVDRNYTHIFNIATYYTDTIDFKIQENQDLTEAEIDNHPLMIEARNFLLEKTVAI